MGRPELADFENSVQIVSAVRVKASAIVTRDASGFKLSKVPVYAPAALLKLLA
jgi:hypothetical protein